MTGQVTVGYLLGRMLPDLPLLPIDGMTIEVEDYGAAVVTWRREYAVADNGRPMRNGDNAVTVNRPGRIVITARIERGEG